MEDIPLGWQYALLALLSVVVFVLGSVLEPRLKLETDPINWVNPDTQVVKDIRKLEKKDFLGGSSELGVFISSTTEKTLFTQEAVDFTDKVLVIVDGIWPQPHMKNAPARFACLYDKRARTAETAELPG